MFVKSIRWFRYVCLIIPWEIRKAETNATQGKRNVRVDISVGIVISLDDGV